MARNRPLLRTPAGGLALVVLFALLALHPAPAVAQGFQSVHSKNGTDVWAVGDGGTWSRSFDGGATWTTGQLTTSRVLRGIAHRGHTVIVVADSGQVFRSTDNGNTWARTVLAGVPDLKAVEMPSADVCVLVGAGETIRRSEDGGASWAAQGPGGGAILYGLRMTGDLEGWAVGSGGRALRTTDGGANWIPIAVPTTLDLYAVDASALRVWVVGARGLALRSTTGGSSWTGIDLRMETPSDVRAVTVSGGSDVLLTGGGGFLRRSADDGTSWTFATHPLIAATSDYFAYDANKAWASAGKTRAVVRTTDGGTTWALPTGTTTQMDWQLKRAAGPVIVRGNTFATTPQNRNSVWCVMGAHVYKSLDRGDSWAPVDTIPSCSKTNSFYVAPDDSNKWIAAVGAPDRVAVTLNAGVSWTAVPSLNRDFTEYGMPLEMNPDKPDTLLFGPEDGKMYRTQNFGATWDTLSPGPPRPPDPVGFRSPCDIVISPDNGANVIVGDGITGSGLAEIFQSEDGGVSWSKRYTGASSETPTLWSSRLANTVVFATNWSSGGVWRSTDSGKNWSQVTTVTSAWGGATATDDPKLVTYGRYAGSPNYVSTDGGTTYTSSSISGGSGYALTTLDRSTILDLHSNGIYKLAVFYTVPAAGPQALALSSPDGGESWTAGSVHAITWSATNLALVALEWRKGPADPWLPIAEVDGAPGSYAWTVPAVPTNQAQVRVRDAADGSPVDASASVFTILAPQVAVGPVTLDFGTRPEGSATLDSVVVSNTGTAPLTVSSISTSTGVFQPGRSSLVLAPGASDSIGVTFLPPSVGSFTDTLEITSNGGAPVRVPLAGSGEAAYALSLMEPDGGEAWQYGQDYAITWQSAGFTNVAIDYRTGDAEPWIELVASTPAAPGSWTWTIPAAATATARVRVREVGGGLIDLSTADFAITVPEFSALPVPRDFGPTPIGYATWDTLRIENKGTAPLTVSSVTSDNGRFTVTRTSFVVLPDSSDTLSVWYLPTSAGPDSALLTFVADDPGTPHAVRLYGTGQPPVGVEVRPLAYALEMARPNPFARETSIRYALPEPTEVALEVFDLGGRRVAVLDHGIKPAGVHAVSFRPGAAGNAGHGALSSGVYFVRLNAGSFSRTQKILHLAP